MINIITNYSYSIVLALIVLSSLSAAVYSSVIYAPLDRSSEPMVIIQFAPMKDGKIVKLDKDTVLSILITAPLPPSMIASEKRDTTIIYSGVVREGAAIKRSDIVPIVDRWIRDYEKRNSRKAPYIGLTIHVDLVNTTKGSVIATGLESITLDLEQLSKGFVGVYTLSLDLGTAFKVNRINIINLDVSGVRYVDSYSASIMFSSVNYEPLAIEATSSATALSLDDYDRCNPVNAVTYICYNRTYYADVETFAEALPSDYFIVVDGVTYVKTPILIAENDLPSYSGTVTASINIGMSNEAIGIYPTYTVGPNIGEALKHPASSTFPSVTLWKGNGIVWGGETYTYGTTLVLSPSRNTGWVWIFTRPYLEVYSVYLVVVGGEPTYLHDEVTAAITDVLIEGDSIVGNYTYDLPVDSLLENFFAGTNETYVTTLAPRESKTLESIFQNYDTCGADFEVGIPVGAMVAAVVSLVAPIASPVAAGIAGFQVSISAVGASIWIYGNIVNQGDLSDVPGDYNVYEGVYMRISRHKYKVDPPWWCPWCSPCYYDAPAGIYFRFV